jgi:ABC-type polysaccharide/polyol phosphate export permease
MDKKNKNIKVFLKKSWILTGLGELIDTREYIKYSLLVALLDLRNRYRRSTLGPFWITLGMAIFVGTISAIYSLIFKESISEVVPHIATGMVVWGFYSSTITECCLAHVNAAGLLGNKRLPIFVPIFGVVLRNTLIFLHHVVVIIIIMALLDRLYIANILWIFLYTLLTFAFLTMVGLILGILSTRYRDFPQIVQSILVIFFYISPIVFRESLFRDHEWLLYLNPFAQGVHFFRYASLEYALSEEIVLGFISTFILVTIAALSLAANYKTKLVRYL